MIDIYQKLGDIVYSTTTFFTINVEIFAWITAPR